MGCEFIHLNSPLLLIGEVCAIFNSMLLAEWGAVLALFAHRIVSLGILLN